MERGFGFLPRHTIHNAHIGSSPKLHYPYHPLYGAELEVFGSVGGMRDLVYVLLKDRSTRGIPAWMFDEAICASVRLSEAPTIDCSALVKLADLLESWKGGSLAWDETTTIPHSDARGAATGETISPSSGSEVAADASSQQEPRSVRGSVTRNVRDGNPRRSKTKGGRS